MLSGSFILLGDISDEFVALPDIAFVWVVRGRVANFEDDEKDLALLAPERRSAQGGHFAARNVAPRVTVDFNPW